MADFKQSYPKHQPLKCAAYWHFRKSGLFLAVYDLVGSMTLGGERDFWVTIEKVAAYFGSSYEVTRRVFKNLVKTGWLTYNPKDRHYQYVSHAQWAEKHPGQCTVRELLSWQVDPDPLVGKIYGILDGKIRLFENHIIALRKFVTDDVFLEHLRGIAAKAKADRADGIYGGTSPKACFWRAYFHFRDESNEKQQGQQQLKDLLS